MSGLPTRVGVGSGSIGLGGEVGGSRFGVNVELGLDEGGAKGHASPTIIQPSGVGPNPELPETRSYQHPAQAKRILNTTPVNPVVGVEGAANSQGWNLAGLLGQSLTGSMSRGLGSVGLPFGRVALRISGSSGVLDDQAHREWRGRAGFVGFRIVRHRTGGKEFRYRGYFPRNQSASKPSL